jgi:choline-sulfatase
MPESPRPNLLVIMSDQHSPHVLGCAGDPVVRTPHLDRLATSGVRFQSAYCGAPLCVPSRSTFMTGQSCSQIGVWTNAGILGSDVPTFAHALAVAGYDTVLCGRMHFRGPDQRHGFTDRPMGDVSPPIGTRPWRVLEGLPPGGNIQQYSATAISGPGRTGYQAFDADVTATTLRWLRERAASNATGTAGTAGTGGAARPFCLVVGLLLPHNPYIAPRALYEEYLDRVGVPEIPAAYWETLHPAVRGWRTSREVDKLTPEQARSARAAYYGLVTMVDDEVGQIVAALDETGLRDNTAVFYTSDHGDMAGELGMWWKSSCYEGSAGVPLLAAWPGRFAAGRRVDEPVSLIDLAPTLVDLGGAAPLPHATGRVLTPLLRGEPLPADWPPVIYAENGPDLDNPPARMVRRGQWKLVHHHGYAQPQLFDLAADPQEARDLGADPAYAAVREDLHALARAGWDGDAVIARSRRQAEEVRPLAAWARAVQPPEPDAWIPPPNCNVFPEP